MMAKLKKVVLIPLAGGVLAAALAAVGACGASKKANLTLSAGDGGTLTKTEYSVKVGADLADFLKDKQPAANVEGLTFAGWYQGADRIEAGFAMPETGLSLTAKYYAPYTLNVYTWDEDAASYGAAAVTTGKAIWHEPFDILSGYTMPENHVLDETQENVTSTSSIEVGFRFAFYQKFGEVHIAFRSNAPDGAEIGGEMLSRSTAIGSSFTLPACAFTAPENYRFAGWTIGKSGEGERYFEGDSIPNVTEDISLFANWDRGFRDLGGGSDIIFIPSEEMGAALLSREGLGEKRGTYSEATRIFTFTLDSGEKLTGRLTDWGRYTFTYGQEGEKAVYTYQNAYTGAGDTAVTLTLDAFDGAVFADTAGTTTGAAKTSAGVYSLYGTLGGTPLYLFFSDDASFIFKLGEGDTFFIQGLEAGEFALLTEEGIDDYYVLELDGFGNALYEAYSDLTGWAVEEGTYEDLGNSEYHIELDGTSFDCLLVYLGDETFAYIVSDPDLVGEFTSADEKTKIALDGYGDLGYATVTDLQSGKSTVYAKYWDVFSLTVDGTQSLYRYLRCIDDYTGAILRSFLFKDDDPFVEVSVEAGEYFMFDLASLGGSGSPYSPYLITFDGVSAGGHDGTWTLYSFEAEGDRTNAARLAGGSYDEVSFGEYTLTLDGAASADAPDAFKSAPIGVMLNTVSSDEMGTVNVFTVSEAKNEMSLFRAGNATSERIAIDGYGIATYTEANGKSHRGTYLVAEFDDEPVLGGDAEADLLLSFTDNSTRENFLFYLPNGLGNDNTFYPMGLEQNSYEGGDDDTVGTYLWLSGFAGDGEGVARFGTTSLSTAGVAFAVEGVYYKVSEEFYGTLWQFDGKTWLQLADLPSLQPTDISFRFVLGTREYDGNVFPVYLTYDEKEEAEYRSPDGSRLIVSGVGAAQFIDADGHVWTGNAVSSEEVDTQGHHIADLILFEYLGNDENYYDFTFRVDLEEKTFLIQSPEVGGYYAFDTEKMLVNAALRLKLDGYGGATLYVPNPTFLDDPAFGTVLVTGTYEETEKEGIFRFTPDPAHPNAAAYPAFTFGCGSYTESSSWQNAEYAVYFVYEMAREGKFINKDWSVLTLNGYDTAVWIDARGRRTEGSFALLGERVVRLTSGGEKYYFNTDAKTGTFSLFEDDFVVEDGVLLAYKGSAQNVVIGEGITEIGRGAFLDAQILSVDLGGVIVIGDRAFDGSALAQIKGGDKVERIGDQAFLRCANLTAANFPKATYAGRQAFAFCYLLESVTLGGEVTFIGDRAFESCYTVPADLTPLGTFKLILGNTKTAPELGGTGVFSIYYGDVHGTDLDFTVRVQGLDALKAFYVSEDWINGSKRLNGSTQIPMGGTYNRNIFFAEAGNEAGAWYATTTLERIVLSGLIAVNGQYFGAYALQNGTLTIYSYTEGQAGNFTTSTATLAGGTLTGAFGGTQRSFKQQGTELTYQNTTEGAFTVTLREEFPLLGVYKGEEVLVNTENGAAYFVLSGYRCTLTLGDGTYTLERTRAAFNEFIEGEDGSSLRITMDEKGNVSMSNGTLNNVNGQRIEFRLTTHCGQFEENGETLVNEYYLDTEIGAIEGGIWRIRIVVTVTIENYAYCYGFTYSAQKYLTLKEVSDTNDTTGRRTAVFGYDDTDELKDIWLRFTDTSTQGGVVRSYGVSGEWSEENNGYLFLAKEGYDPVEGNSFFIMPKKDTNGNITSVAITEFIREIEFEGNATDGSHVKLSSKKGADGTAVVTVEGTFQSVSGKPFAAKATGKAEFVSGYTFAVYTTKELDETKYYRILITLEPDQNTFTYTFAEAGKVAKTEKTTALGENYTVWVYSPSMNFNSETWFFVQLETLYKGETVLLDGNAKYNNQYPYNAEFVVTTEGDFEGRLYRMRIGYGMGISDFIAL